MSPLTKTGKKVKGKMEEEYGKKKGKSVFYATMSKKGMKGEWEGRRNKAYKMMGGKKK